MTAEHAFLEDIVQKEFGFSSMDAFVKQQTYCIFQQRFDETQAIIARYETKYGMNLTGFQERVVNADDELLRPFGIIEKEDDLMDWEFQDHALPYYQQRLQQLSA